VWDLEDLKYFEAVIAQGSFAEAARYLGVTRSAVSKAVRRLEEQLSVQLLVRTNRSLHVTEAGHALHGRAQEILNISTTAREEMEGFRDAAGGVLKMTAPNALGLGLLGPLLLDFLRENPEVKLDLSLADRIVDLQANGIDLALRTAVGGTLRDRDLMTRKLGDGRRYLCASPDWLKQNRNPESPDDLRDANCLIYDPHLGRTRSHRWEFSGPQGTRTATVQGALRSDSCFALLDAVVGGAGIALLPGFLSRAAIADGRLVELLPEWHPRSYTLWALFGRTPHCRLSLRRLIDFLAARMETTAL